jgi:hypothetical protein
VFEALYQKPFSRLTSPFDNDQLKAEFISKVVFQMGSLFKQLVQGKTSVEIHKEVLANFADKLVNVKSTATCLCCIRRNPQYCQSCQHIICENCVIAFGSKSEDPWLFEIHQCFICQQKLPKGISIKLRPPTAGVGVLCLDGGGSRAALSLKTMKRMEDRAHIIFQELFQVAFGVSSGMYMSTRLST